MLHWDGSALSVVPSPTDTVKPIGSVYAFSKDDVVVGGAWGKLWRYDGASWNLRTAPGVSTTTSIWGTSSEDFWSTDGQVLHWVNGVATVVDLAPLPADSRWYVVSGTSENDVWLFGRQWTEAYTGRRAAHFDGTQWSLLDPPAGVTTDFFTDALPLAPGRVLAFGSSGLLAEHDLEGWRHVNEPLTADVKGLWEARGTVIAHQTDRLRIRTADRAWKPVIDEHAGEPVRRVSSISSANNIWYMTSNSDGLYHWNGSRATFVKGGWEGETWTYSRAATWLMHGVTLYRREDAGDWQPLTKDIYVQGRHLWVSPTGRVWIAGAFDPIGYLSGDKMVYPATDPSVSVYVQKFIGRTSNDIWLAGSRYDPPHSGYLIGAVARWNGHDLVQQELPPGTDIIRDVWIGGKDDVWFTSRGRVLHYDGTSWRVEDPGTLDAIFVAGVPGRGVWIAGGNRVLFKPMKP